MHKNVVLILSICYTILIAYLSLAKLNAPPQVDLPQFTDKIVHATMYFIFTGLWFYVLFANGVKKSTAILFTLVIAILFGIIIEVLQHTLTNYRQFEILDIFANTIGVLIMSVLLMKIKYFNIKMKQ